ncbi:putative protein kinase [Leptomonas pyrrhocoris]|uniref:Protein kinase domain-containing protein n=1 Tax=Leptomonas pyrrhocoris TaxID=157538 RepID=A0A0N0DUE5_LEPPY|nr:putative protein kinase [Leptomonas pyrrhocoris]XP_015657251.1 putative protein kinase [Leptomonas pyrrhocoris]KPA78811.1 putative protein kinase [Leptomonas pyrrhocoris]KPA78812.1 putative protein kinase [Leptomonas pyrrhocoris]|eukprot:XP_015657250.1 putative protein kinase [Leptomonas pyrrhocoris]
MKNARGPASTAANPLRSPQRLWVQRRPQQTETRKHSSVLHSIKRFVCRIDVCWTFFFFVLLVCVAATTTSITQIKISHTLLDNLHDVHALHITVLSKKLNQGNSRLVDMAAGYLALHADTPFQFRSEKTLSTLCTLLKMYDITIDFRFLAISSPERNESVACLHGDDKLGSVSQLYGWITENGVIPGVYLVNDSSNEFMRPLQPVYGGWPKSQYNLSRFISLMYHTSAVFPESAAYFNGSIEYIDYRTMWNSFDALPHIIYCTIPAGFLFRGLKLPDGVSVMDYVGVRVNGAGLLLTRTASSLTNITAAIFINATLTDEDPSVMSNNWGQQSVNDTEILSHLEDSHVRYLKVSNVSNPLMRAALRHVDLKALQQEGCNRTVDFQYRGAPATVTAIVVTTSHGLTLPMVFASSDAATAMPYRRIMNICNGATAIAVVLFTALFWLFVHRYMHQPLQRVSRRMLGNLRAGHRAHTREPHLQLFRLTEVHALLQAHRSTVERLREIDAFIPRDVQEQMAHGVRSPSRAAVHRAAPAPAGEAAGEAAGAGPSCGALLQQVSTLVYVTVRPCDDVPAPMRSPSTLAALAQQPHTRQRLASVVARAARAAELVNSGPFPTPAALEGFVAALHELSEEYGGTVHRLTPDSCVLHFGKAVRAHMTRGGGGGGGCGAAAAREQACAARDARNAMRFALALQRWVDRCGTPSMPDVRVLADTSEFICGQYRPTGSEQTLLVALGRDVQRKLGHVPASIGVRIAMTEETARLVRGGQAGCGAAGAVRQIPVEAFQVGRAGLNADVVILFEALPGPVRDDEAWRLYWVCCVRAFSCMVRGNYAGALSAYREVADISDLEPGLMPASLRREAARSDVTGGAVSVQAERLMRECERRVACGDVRLFYRERHVPLGIDALLCGVTPAGVVPETVEPRVAAEETGRSHGHPVHTESRRAPMPVPKATERRVVLLGDGGDAVKTVIGSTWDWFQDNNDLRWHVAARPHEYTPIALWNSRLPCLGEAGLLATMSFFPLRDVPPVVANAIRDAPVGPMSDALRSAVPVVGATPRQKAALHTLYRQHGQLQHPNLLVPLSYSTSVEGGVVVVWEYNSGGTLRELAARYYRIKPLTEARFMLDVASVLAYLHQHGVVHGGVSLDNVFVGADGACRLRGHCVDITKLKELFCVPRLCYVSPAMAAGAVPTPACDMFCYGLMGIELLSGAAAWKWAPVPEGQPQRSAEELSALMADAAQPFFDAVVAGRIVANTDALDAMPLTDETSLRCYRVVRDCLSPDPLQRPTARVVRRLSSALLAPVEAELGGDVHA